MLTDEAVPAEGARYAAPVVLVPGLWAGRDVWRRWATYLAHRGWECRIVDLRGSGDVAVRVEALTAYLATLDAAPVVVGHDLGAAVAIAAARRRAVAAVVLLAPVEAGRATRTLAAGVARALAVALGRSVAPPDAAGTTLLLSGLDATERTAVASRLAADDGAAFRDLLRGRARLERSGVPSLVVGGAHDPLMPADAAAALAAAIGAELHVVDGGHWLLAGAAWQRAADDVHRWLVQRLGEPLLETYADAMADAMADATVDRDGEDD